MSSISPLPDSVTRQIRSYVAVVSPDILVKELLDNAIDAKASSVDIVISHDTVSKIQVRDNGVGIHPNDYNALARRGYTSKLKNLEELPNVVGHSLGFRGEALANINTLGDITITTKTSTEPIAAVLRLAPNQGGVLKQNVTSAPVGTTLCVTGVFGRQPVREQIAIKEAKKTIDKVQELLRAYAMARPQLRLQFKVLPPSNRTWFYSPRHDATPKEAALHLFGVELASSCSLSTLQRHLKCTEGSVVAGHSPGHTDECFVLEALLIKPDVDFQKIPKRHYFSVDRRPLNAGRGTAKKLLKIFLDYLRRSASPRDIRDGFIRLDIRCPPKSYDPNIEPAKDNVLFSDEQLVLDAFREMCSEAYPTAKINHQEPQDISVGAINTTSIGSPGFQASTNSDIQPGGLPNIPEPARGMWRSNRSMLAESVSSERGHSHDRADSLSTLANDGGPMQLESASRPGSVDLMQPYLLHRFLQSGDSRGEQDMATPGLTQWKDNVSDYVSEQIKNIHERQDEAVLQSAGSQGTVEGRELNMKGYSGPGLNSEMRRVMVAPSDPGERTEFNTQPPFTPEHPVLRHPLAPPGDLHVPRDQQHLQNSRLLVSRELRVPGGPYRSPLSTPSHNRVPDTRSDRSHLTLRPRREQLPWTPPSSTEKNRHGSRLQGPCITGLSQTQISFGGTRASRPRRGPRDNMGDTQEGSQLLVNTVEDGGAEGMKAMISTARQHLDYQMSQMEDRHPADTNRNPTHVRPLAHGRPPFGVIQPNSFKGKEANKDAPEPIATTLPTGDPRAYLLRRQKSAAPEEGGAKKRKRAKSDLMPLESIPPGYETHALLCTMSLPTSVLDTSVRLLREYDEYVIYGTFVEGLELSLCDGEEVQVLLNNLLSQQKENIGRGANESD
ncbi:hypothetical protein GGS20DRAFT_590937 [Poronia punctata]|nr:hypothetical protein GGS20DRAFT_590937 [Poronia punctata]